MEDYSPPESHEANTSVVEDRGGPERLAPVPVTLEARALGAGGNAVSSGLAKPVLI